MRPMRQPFVPRRPQQHRQSGARGTRIFEINRFVGDGDAHANRRWSRR